MCVSLLDILLMAASSRGCDGLVAISWFPSHSTRDLRARSVPAQNNSFCIEREREIGDNYRSLSISES